MKITVYGSTLCPKTMRLLAILTEHNIMPEFVNFTGSIGLLRDFIAFRDTSPLYEDMRGSGSIGLPLVELEDGTRTRDVKSVLKTFGIDESFDL